MQPISRAMIAALVVGTGLAAAPPPQVDVFATLNPEDWSSTTGWGGSWPHNHPPFDFHPKMAFQVSGPWGADGNGDPKNPGQTGTSYNPDNAVVFAAGGHDFLAIKMTGATNQASCDESLNKGWHNGNFNPSFQPPAGTRCYGAWVSPPSPSTPNPVNHCNQDCWPSLYGTGNYRWMLNVPRANGSSGVDDAAGCRSNCGTGGVVGAFLIAWNPNGSYGPFELDFEWLLNEPDSRRVHLTVHSADGAQQNSFQATLPFDASVGFHCYDLRWKKDEVEFFADNMLLRTVPLTGKFSVPSSTRVYQLGNIWAHQDGVPSWGGFTPDQDAVATFLGPVQYVTSETGPPAACKVPNVPVPSSPPFPNRG